MLIKSLPTSDATNVYDLLQDVKQAILEEPRRLNMHHVARDVKKGDYFYFERKPGAQRSNHFVPLPKPTCGTVGCFAGWTMLLAGLTPVQAAREWIVGAMQLLGPTLNYKFRGSVSEAQQKELGEPSGLYDVFNWGGGDGIIDLKPGTRAYARAVVRRINGFIERNGGKAVLSKLPLNRIRSNMPGSY